MYASSAEAFQWQHTTYNAETHGINQQGSNGALGRESVQRPVRIVPRHLQDRHGNKEQGGWRYLEAATPVKR